MSNSWIEKQREHLVARYKKCRSEGESILEAFSLYLLRILNGLAQMENSDTYGYESRILGDVMRLFCTYYTEQVDEVLGQGANQQIDAEKREEIIEDLEDAISKISSVYKNVIDSTSNSDRQLFTSHAAETSIYDISPKLFAAYSGILETLVDLFGKKDVYAFLLHPSLKSNVQTVNLFDTRQMEGKVVLVYIPENKIEEVRQIPFYLLHEAFHVLTREERCRKERACKMEVHMFNAISQRLFRNVSFDFIDEIDDMEIENELMQRWFRTEGWLKELRDRSEDDREFYSRNVIARICANWRDALGNIFLSLGEDLCQVLAGKKYPQKSNPYAALIQVEWEIQRNLVEILADNQVERYATAYMHIYREAYADIASILAAGISPDIYQKAFLESEVEPTGGELEPDVLREIRVSIVAKTIADCAESVYAEEWKAYCGEHDLQRQKECLDKEEKPDEEGVWSRWQNQNDKFWFQETDLEAFEIILAECGRKLWKKLGRENSIFEGFRRILADMDIIHILSGQTNKSLTELKNMQKVKES